MLTSSQDDPLTLETCPVNNTVHNFTAMGLYFNIIKMTDSFVLWVGHDAASIESIGTAIALSNPPVGSKLLGTNTWSKEIAVKLASKTKHQVFVFMDDLEKDELPMAEKIIFQKLKSNPEMF